MSLAQFNGVSTPSNILCNSVTFPDGSSLTSANGSAYTITQSASDINSASSGANTTIATFNNLKEGRYHISFPYTLSNTSPFLGVTVFVNTTLVSYKLDSFTYIQGTGNSGIQTYQKNFNGIITITTPQNITVSVSATLAVPTGNTWSGTAGGSPILLVKLV